MKNESINSGEASVQIPELETGSLALQGAIAYEPNFSAVDGTEVNANKNELADGWAPGTGAVKS